MTPLAPVRAEALLGNIISLAMAHQVQHVLGMGHVSFLGLVVLVAVAVVDAVAVVVVDAVAVVAFVHYSYLAPMEYKSYQPVILLILHLDISFLIYC